MKKVITNSILILIALMMIGCDEIVQTGNDLAKQHLTGAVKQLKENDYKGVGKDRVLLSSSVKSFNEQGNIVTDDRYKGSVLDYNITCKYNQDGKIATSRIYQKDSIILQKTWTYDKQRLVKYEDAKKNGYIETTTFVYDDNGNCIKDFINKTWVMDKNLRRFAVKDYVFDASNRCIETKEYSQYEKDTLRHFYEYDNGGNCINEKIENQNGSKQMRNRKFYGNGIMKEEVMINGYKDDIQEIRYYNKRGDMEKIEYYSNKVKQSEKTFEYKYDKQGNWIMMTTLANGKPLKMTERTIIYY